MWMALQDAKGNVVTQLTAAQVKKLTKENIIAGGMIPKTETALAAIDGGVRAVVIIDGRVPECCATGIIYRSWSRVFNQKEKLILLN